MKLENTEILPLFSKTEIPDIFFSEYLSQANGDFIKVYLYLLLLDFSLLEVTSAYFCLNMIKT